MAWAAPELWVHMGFFDVRAPVQMPAQLQVEYTYLIVNCCIMYI